MGSSAGIAGSLSKWQVALVVGAPLAFGLGYLYYKKSGDTSDKKKDRRKAKGIGASRNGQLQRSIDGDSSHAVPSSAATPVEQAELYKQKGNQLFSCEKFDEAIVQYNLAIEVCPKENTEALATFYQNRAAAYEKLQKFSAVNEDCTQALALKPKYIKALVRRARALEYCNDFEAALNDITLAYFLEDFSNDNTLELAEKILKKLNEKDVEEFMATRKPVLPSKYFISKYLSGYYNDPIVKSTDEILDESRPFNKALKALKKEEYDDIIPLCTEVLSVLGPDDNSMEKFKTILLRGTFYHLLSYNDEALADFNTVINSEMSSPQLKVNALIKRGNMQLQEDNTTTKAFEDFAEAEKLDPECGDIYHNRGEIHLFLNKTEEAKDDFEKSVKLNPDFDVTYVQKCYADYGYAKSKNDMNLLNTVKTDFKKAFEKFPKCVQCYILYAQILMGEKEFEKADSYFLKALELDPENATIYVHRGFIQMNWKHDIDKGIELIEKAIEIDDKCEYAYNILGSMQAQRGNLKEAINIFNKALLILRNTAEILHIIGLRNVAKSQLTVSESLQMTPEKFLKKSF